MDSIVDSFFPLLEQVEKEMMKLENVMFSEDVPTSQPAVAKGGSQVTDESDTAVSQSHSNSFEKDVKNLSPDMDEKVTTSVLHTQFSLPKRHVMSMRSLKIFLGRLTLLVPRFNFKVKQAPKGEQATHDTVRRVARVRRLVTSLSRILATKSEVVAQVKKRLLMVGESGLSHGNGSDHDVYIYLGDVQGLLV